MKLNNKHELPMPRTNFQEVLFTLINQGNCSFFDFEYLQGFRTRISDIRQNIKITTTMQSRCNKFGNTYSYAIHILPENELQNAIDLYYECLKSK
jgi:hypothetical protein